jgi:hypothetical protein
VRLVGYPGVEPGTVAMRGPGLSGLQFSFTGLKRVHPCPENGAGLENQLTLTRLTD